MNKLTTTNCSMSDKSLQFIDRQVAKLKPYFTDADDELPILDVILEKGKARDTYLGSVTVFLPDASIHAHAENKSADVAIRQAFDGLGHRITAYEINKQRRHRTARRIFGQPRETAIA
jgi:ribosome-associated translation inhibitor RaiA